VVVMLFRNNRSVVSIAPSLVVALMDGLNNLLGGSQSKDTVLMQIAEGICRGYRTTTT
jgi:hypothetical protein